VKNLLSTSAINHGLLIITPGLLTRCVCPGLAICILTYRTTKKLPSAITLHKRLVLNESANCGFQADRDFNAAVNERKLCNSLSSKGLEAWVVDKLQTAVSGIALRRWVLAVVE